MKRISLLLVVGLLSMFAGIVKAETLLPDQRVDLQFFKCPGITVLNDAGSQWIPLKGSGDGRLYTVISSGSITVNTVPNVWVTSGTITVDNLNPSYKNVVIDSGNITVNGNITVDNQYKNVVIDSGTIINKDDRYHNEDGTVKISSGVFVLITGVTSYTIDITDKVTSWKIKYNNDSDKTQYMKMDTSYMGPTSSLCDQDFDDDILITPTTSNFILTDLSVNSTTQLRINYLKQ